MMTFTAFPAGRTAPGLRRAARYSIAMAFAALLLPMASQADAQRRPLGERVQRRAGDAAAARDSLQVGGLTRTYVVRAPRDITPRDLRSRAAGSPSSRRGELLPLVIVLHGGGGNAQNAETMTRFTALVERERLVVVYPDGTGNLERRARGPSMFTWNAVHCCAAAMKNDVDDVAFIGALIDRLSATYPVDPARVYVTGMSNGAMMSHRIGRELSARIAAIAPVVGAVFGDEALPSSPVSAIMINGLLDTSVPPDGGPPGGIGRSQWDADPRANLEQGSFWARANGCQQSPTRSEQGQVITWRWTCPAGRAVELHQLRDGTHEWPGGPRGRRGAKSSSVSMDATEVIWAFFKAHPKRN